MASKSAKDSEKIAEQLHSVAIHLLRKLRREDDTSGLNAPRLSALSVIVFGGPITLGDLARAEQVRAPTMTRIVNALEEQRLVTREKAPDDGRLTYLSATTTGRNLLIAGRERRVRALAAQVGKLSKDRLVTLQSATEILREIVGQI